MKPHDSEWSSASAVTAPAPYVLIWVLFVYAWVGNYLIRIGFSALLPPVIDELGLSYTEAGVLASVFFTAYAVIQVPAGVLGDRFGRRRILLLGLVAGALASVATGLTTSFAMLLVVRGLTGASQGCLFSNDRAIIASVTPAEKIVLGQSVSFLGPGVGLAAGLLLGGLLGELMPWRAVFFVFALPPIVAVLLITRFVPAGAPAAGGPPLGQRLRSVLGQGALWLLGLTGAGVLWVQYLLATWSPLLFIEAGVTELGRAGVYSSLQGLAGAAGLLAGGWVGDRLSRRGVGPRAFLVATLVLLAAAVVALAVVVQRAPGIAGLAASLLVVAFFAWGAWGPSFALLGEVFRGRDLSTAFGLYNTVVVVGAIVGPAVTGWTRDLTGSFALGVYLSAVVALAGALTALTIRPGAPLEARQGGGRP